MTNQAQMANQGSARRALVTCPRRPSDMCGVTGALGFMSPSVRHAVRSMQRAMAHRGPDGEGFWEWYDESIHRGVILAHRRLAIIDLSDHAAQPMTDRITG